MNDDLRVALIGYGLGGRAFHAPLIAATDGLCLTAIVTSNPERRAAAARQFPGATVLDSADSLWANARDYDLAVVTTPNRTHVELARAAIAARISVIVDKPMAATAREARELVAEAKRAGVPISAYHNRRWDGEILTLQRLIANGDLGDVFRFESRLDRWRPSPVADAWRERGAPEEAGGLLYDLGPHLIDQSRLLFGAVSHVYAELDRRRPGVTVHDDVFIALRHSNGVRSHLWMSSVAAQPGPRLRALGTRAAYTKHSADVQEAALRAGTPADAPGFGEDPRSSWGMLGAGDDVRPVETEKGDYRRFYSLCIPWLRDGAPPPVDPMDAIAVLNIIHAAQRSVTEAKVVSLSLHS